MVQDFFQQHYFAKQHTKEIVAGSAKQKIIPLQFTMFEKIPVRILSYWLVSRDSGILMNGLSVTSIVTTTMVSMYTYIYIYLDINSNIYNISRKSRSKTQDEDKDRHGATQRTVQGPFQGRFPFRVSQIMRKNHLVVEPTAK